MKKIIKIVLGLAIILGLAFTGYYFFLQSKETPQVKIARETTGKVQRFIEKEVEIYQLDGQTPDIQLQKNGTLEAKSQINVSSEISGKITTLNVSVGDTVQEGQILASLGDSLGTDSLDIQYQAAADNLKISRENKKIAQKLAEQNIISAQINADSAQNGLTNSSRTKDSTLESLLAQRESLEINLDSAEDSRLKTIHSINDTERSLFQAENELEDYLDNIPEAEDPNPEVLAGLEGSITALKTQITGLEEGLSSLETATKQARASLNQFDEGYDIQIHGLDFSVQSSVNQLLLAQNQELTSEIAKIQQLLASDSQIIQAEQSEKIARLNLEKKEIKAPISGTVTSISLNENEFATPNQTILTIENLEKSIVTTSVNSKEKELFKAGNKVEIVSDNQKLTGFITYIAPTIDQNTQKFKVEVEIDNNGIIPSDSLVKINFKSSNLNKIFVPINSVFLFENDKYVKVLNSNNKVLYTSVSTGPVVNNFIEITSGLQGNETIIRNQNQFLKHGEKVKIASNN